MKWSFRFDALEVLLSLIYFVYLSSGEGAYEKNIRTEYYLEKLYRAIQMKKFEFSLTNVLAQNNELFDQNFPVKMIWKYPQMLNISSHIIIEKIEKNSTCDLSAVDDNVTIDSLQVVFMTKRCISGYCRNPVRDRGINGLMLIECSEIFSHVQDLGMNTVALLEDQCNACSNENNDSTLVGVNDLEIEDKNPWWSVGYWNFWKNSPSK